MEKMKLIIDMLFEILTKSTDVKLHAKINESLMEIGTFGKMSEFTYYDKLYMHVFKELPEGAMLRAPQKLYRYRGCVEREGEYRDISSLKDNTLWFGAASKQNDPVDSVAGRYKSIMKQEYHYISCFTDLYNSDYMWNRYGEERRGFCLEYDFHDFGEIFPVCYVPENLKDFFYEHGVMYPFIKDPDPWIVENEWRWCIMEYENKQRITRKIPNPQRIILGEKIDKKAEDQIRRFAEERRIEIVK